MKVKKEKVVPIRPLNQEMARSLRYDVKKAAGLAHALADAVMCTPKIQRIETYSWAFVLMAELMDEISKKVDTL